jgi:hypothetical protein
MKRYAPDRAIRRKATIGRILSFGGMGILFAGFFISLNKPELYNVVLFTMLAGFFVSQTGLVLLNRWGRRPRVDELLDRGLKGLPGDYSIFHYLMGANHVLIGPVGVLVLLPYIIEGEILYQEGQWWQIRERRGKKRRKKLKQFQVDVDVQMNAARKFLRRFMEEEKLPPIRTVLVFLHPNSTVHAADSDPPAVHLKKLKPFIRKMSRSPRIPPEVMAEILSNLKQEG